MSEKQGIALSSSDGRVWSEQSQRALQAAAAPVARIVIGALQAEEALELTDALREEMWAHWSTLTHLHLWGIANLEKLPELPTGLQCLDLRACSALTALPALPPALRSLDLGGCSGLAALPEEAPAQLTHLHLDGCTALPGYAINVLVARCRHLEEITLSGCEAPRDMEGLAEHGRGDAAPGLRRLVLEGCSKLGALPDLSGFPQLHHLNLNGCAALEALPELPVPEEPEQGLQYLVTADCERLQSYRGLDIRAVHRSDHADDNIVDTVRAFRHLGDAPVELRCSKLLLLGSGRVGKTTLAKALQWESLTSAERRSPEGRELDPVAGSPSTYGIQFWNWPGRFRLPGDADGDEGRPGTVHIWDFAGQEIYHNTHRMFAAAGSVFAVVCTDRGEHRKRLEREIECDGLKGAEREDFEKENQYRELRYWLDYVRNALGLGMQEVHRLPVLLVHSGSRDTDLDYLRQQAGPYARCIDDGTLRRHVLDCTDHAFVGPGHLQELMPALAQKLGRAADGLGTRVPAFYQSAHGWVEARLPHPEPPFQPFPEWCKSLREGLDGQFPALAFEPPVMRAVTRYLHRIGRVFWLNEAAAGEVLVDQSLGAEAVYQLCTRAPARTLRDRGGRFDAALLESLLRDSSSVKTLGTQRFLHLLERCDICAPDGQSGYQALHPDALSPRNAELERTARAQWLAVAAAGRGHLNHCFRLSGKDGMMIGAADYQALAAWVARAVGDGSLPQRLLPEDEETHPRHVFGRWDERWRIEPHFWRDGLQIGMLAGGDDRHQDLVLRIQFNLEQELEQEYAFEGSLYIELLTADEDRAGQQLRGALFADDGPLGTLRGHLEEDDHRPETLPPEKAHRPRDQAMWPWAHSAAPAQSLRRHDVAISYRRADRPIAVVLHEALEAAGLYAYIDLEDDRLKLIEAGEGSRISDIYSYLEQAQCLIIVCSKDYFDLEGVEPRRGNVYCPVELAAAVVSLSRAEDPRPATRMLHFARTGQRFDWRQFDARVKETLENFKTEVIDPRERASSLDDYEDLQVGAATRDLQPFLEGCGSNARQAVLWDESAPDNLGERVAEMVDRIRQA